MKDGMALAEVKHKTPRLCLIAVRQNWNALQFCKFSDAPMDRIVMHDIIYAAIRQGDIKAVWIACTNPAQSMPQVALVREALSRA